MDDLTIKIINFLDDFSSNKFESTNNAVEEFRKIHFQEISKMANVKDFYCRNNDKNTEKCKTRCAECLLVQPL